MKNGHINDNEIQEYVLNKANGTLNIVEHMNSCQSCRDKAEAYRLLFAEIETQKKPEFDFDLTALVLSGIAHKEPANTGTDSVIWIIILTGLASIGITGYLFGRYLVSVFAGISGITIWLVLTAAFVLALLQASEMYRKYRKQMEALGFD
jgi:hypothetical protein